jgi:hypothetical protein
MVSRTLSKATYSDIPPLGYHRLHLTCPEASLPMKDLYSGLGPLEENGYVRGPLAKKRSRSG